MVSQGTQETFKGLIISVLQTIPDHIAVKENVQFFLWNKCNVDSKANKNFTINKTVDMSHV